MFCKGQVDFTVIAENESLTGYVRIPREEYSVSDDDFEVWINTVNGDVEASDFHEEINPLIDEIVFGDDMFLDLICDNAHHTTELINGGVTIIIDGSDFEWE